MMKTQIDPKLFAPYIDHPIEFVEDLIFKYYPSNPKPVLNRHQIEMFEAVVDGDWVTVRSGRGRGKTTAVALLIPWYLVTRPMSRVIATGPKADQLSDVLWAAISKWLQFSPLKEILLWSKEKVVYTEYPDTWYAVARTAKSKENLSGFHEEYQMMIADEASGIPDEICETIEQTQTNNVNKKEIKTILISNPTKVTGYFYKTHKLAEWAKFWKRLHFRPTNEELAADAGAQRIVSLYGIDHDITLVSVFGEFPSGNPQAVISYSDAWDAMNRTVIPEGTIEIGADIARFGDDLTVLFYRYGYKVFPCVTFKKQDTFDTANSILTLVRELRMKFKYDKVIRIKIDDAGAGGGVSDSLIRNTTDGIEVVQCLFGEKGNEFYANSASIMWADLSKMIGKLELPRDDFMFEEICGRNWEVSLASGSRQKVESKDEFKKRIHRSPDRADALVLCCSNTQEKDKILPKLVDIRDDVFKNVPIHFDFVSWKRAELFGSVWHEKDIRQSCLVALWDKEIGHLTVFYEGTTRMEGPDEIVTSLLNICEMYNVKYHTEIKPRRFMWFGNRAMFGLSDSSIEFTNAKDGPFLSWQNKHLIAIQPNFYFDLNGAILKLNEMFDQSRIAILSDLPMLKMQLETWKIDNERPDNEGHALCLALCNIISMMMQTKRMKKDPKKLVPYGVQILPSGALKIGGSKEVFLNKAEKIFAEGHNSKIKMIIPTRISAYPGPARPGADLVR